MKWTTAVPFDILLFSDRLLVPSRGSVLRDPLSTGPTHPPLT